MNTFWSTMNMVSILQFNTMFLSLNNNNNKHEKSSLSQSIRNSWIAQATQCYTSLKQLLGWWGLGRRNSSSWTFIKSLNKHHIQGHSSSWQSAEADPKPLTHHFKQLFLHSCVKVCNAVVEFIRRFKYFKTWLCVD